MTNTTSISRRLVRLPCYLGLTDEQQGRVIELLRRFFESR
jgi:dTDP-4-amino-4,6-dideoxygalactose transaminase